MNLQGQTVLVLGGAGLVGTAVCRRLLKESPAHLIVAAGHQASAERAVKLLRTEASPGARIDACWGNIFVRWEYKDFSWGEILADPGKRQQVLKDLLDPLENKRKDEILAQSTLARTIAQYRPHAIVDCINTATAFAYQDVYESARELLASLDGPPETYRMAVERHLVKMYTPQLVRHMQILYEALSDADNDWPGVQAYVKVGTTGTGGMGLNIPYTHGEEKPSSVLLSKTAVAGAHSLLLFLLARTPPDRPAVKEIKPAAAIGWAEIGYGPISQKGRSVALYDCPPELAYDLADASVPTGEFGIELEGKSLENVYIDTGENGLYALAEFSTLTALRQMEFITAEEVAENVVLELKGGNTGYDMISALDQAVLGPSYRAGWLRGQAIARMQHLAREKGAHSIAFEALGPPRLSKLLFEAYLLQQVSQNSIQRVKGIDPLQLARACYEELVTVGELRTQAISVGIPILLPEGDRLLRGPTIKAGKAEQGWIDLRPENMRLWQERLAKILELATAEQQADGGMYASRFDRLFVDAATGQIRDSFDIGTVVGWLFSDEEQGFRMKS
ncbi:MAG: hypothetical protein AB4040_21285 [Synechococcus sp.]